LLVPVTALVVIWGFTATLTIERGLELLRIQTVYDNVVTPVRGVISALQQERFLIGFQVYDRLMISPDLDLVEQTKAIILVSRSREIVSQESAVVTGALAEQGLPADGGWEIRVPDTPEGGAILADRLLVMSPRHTAVVLAQETPAIGLYRRLREAGVEPGADLAVVGFRKNPVCDYLVPSLTSFEVSLEDYGLRLGEIVLDRLSAGPDDQPVHEVGEMTIVPGESDAHPPRS
jgi:Periplasmic binding protein-like domain